ELADALLGELLEAPGVDEHRMWVEALQAAVDHVLDQFALGLRVQVPDIFMVDFVEDIDDEADHLIILVLFPQGRALRDSNTQQGDRGSAEQPGEIPAWHDGGVPPVWTGPTDRFRQTAQVYKHFWAKARQE